MADVTLTYKGSTIAEMDATGTKTLKTAGKYCEGDIGISYVKPSGGGSAPEIPDSAFVLSGDCQNLNFNGHWNKFINAYANRWSTNNINNISSAFDNSHIGNIPFQINLGNYVYMSRVFVNCDFSTPPVINGTSVEVRAIISLFYNCKMKNIPDDYFNFIGTLTNNCSMNNTFWSCTFLRNFPSSANIIPRIGIRTSPSSSFYSSMCSSCYVLDEITNLGVSPLTYTSEAFGSCVTNCFRLKNFTFESGKTVNWKNQTIDLSTVGYGLYDNQAQPAGITIDKKVTDDSSYQSLKNDTDWYTFKAAYSRYNHDSAVATINSLPDASAYIATQSGATNTIKFEGDAGSATDGGAINTLTEEEIAIATAKGWTVSLV